MRPGEHHRVIVERMVQGGRSLARVEGQVVLVAGAIPGETVSIRIAEVRRGAVLADVAEVHEASSDRRDVFADLSCGGLGFGHIAYPRQLALKQEVLIDAFRRIARLELDAAPVVRPSPEERYRMRARVHVRHGRIGAFRERTHEICSMALTRQLDESTDALFDEIGRRAAAHGIDRVEAIELSENLETTACALHVETGGVRLPTAWLAEVASLPRVAGVSLAPRREDRARVVAGEPWVSDAVAAFVPLAGAGATLRRQAHAFFQANRFLTPGLVQRVMASLGADPVVDLYAGVGLFAVSAAASGRDGVVAVERDETSSADLVANAQPWAGRVRVVRETVESFIGRGRLEGAGTLIVDPPRTGMSRDVVEGILAARAASVVYVSCDTATLARDAGRLVARGYHLAHLESFDLFPNTPHIETVAVFG